MDRSRRILRRRKIRERKEENDPSNVLHFSFQFKTPFSNIYILGRLELVFPIIFRKPLQDTYTLVLTCIWQCTSLLVSSVAILWKTGDKITKKEIRPRKKWGETSREVCTLCTPWKKIIPLTFSHAAATKNRQFSMAHCKTFFRTFCYPYRYSYRLIHIVYWNCI